MKIAGFAAALLAGASAVVLAADPVAPPGPGANGMRERMVERFRNADKNADGQISKEEAQSGMPMLAQRFDEIDTNKDGKIDLDELRAMRRGPPPAR